MRSNSTGPMPTPEEMYRRIRGGPPVDIEALDDDDDALDGDDGVCSDAWEGIGCYLGDGVWGNPEYFGIPGEYEFAYRSATRTKGATR